MKKHKIGWLNVPGYTPETWNPIVGCSKISAGCLNCYAERMACRLAGMTLDGYVEAVVNKQWNGQTYLLFDALEKPTHWKKPRAIFVNSMGDLFHEDTDSDWIFRVFSVIEECPQHLFIILTKRADRMQSWVQHSYVDRYGPIPKNVWLGVTAENQAAADLRIPHLLDTPAAVRFVSCEPMIGEIDLCIPVGCRSCNHPGNVRQREGCMRCGGSGREPSVDWVICGGETGPGARKMQYQWAEGLRDQCFDYGVPFFFKQWGAHPPTQYHRCEWKDLMLDGKRYHEFAAPYGRCADNTAPSSQGSVPSIGNGGDE